MELERSVKQDENVVGNRDYTNLENIKHKPIEKIPALEEAFRTARRYVYQTVICLGLSPVPMTYSDIRLVSGQDYEKYVDGPDCQKPSAGRFHHDIGKAFVRESMSLDNKFCSVYLASVMVHEMWHKALGWEFNERDSDLCEGLTEYLTRETMKFVKPAILNPIELAEDKSRIARVSKCAKVCADDFIVSLSSGACLSYSYLDKMKQIESLAVYSPKEFRKFLRNVITWGQPVSEARAA